MHQQTEHHERRPEPGAPMGTDPVCGMKVPLTSPHRYAVNGSEVVFCSTRCRGRFASEPSKYLSGEEHEPPSATAPSKGAYTCPMHPEVRADQPGSCPKCGMALERVSPGPAVRAEWTCPMHPEIVRDAPGTCPICGMALEPRAGGGEEEDNVELRDMSRRFWLAALFTAAMPPMAPVGSTNARISFSRRTRLPDLRATSAFSVSSRAGSA